MDSESLPTGELVETSLFNAKELHLWTFWKSVYFMDVDVQEQMLQMFVFVIPIHGSML